MVERSSAGSSNQKNGVDVYGTVVLVLEIIVLQIRLFYLIIKSFIEALLPVEAANVQNSVVLITGTGHGIGKELALKYSSLGAKVICWDINEQNNEQTVQEIKAAGGKAFAYTCDVMNRNEINELAERNKREHGFINIIVNNAGIMPCHPLMEHTETEIRNMYEINVIAHFWIIQAFLPDMISRNEGHIVALSSCAGLFGLPNLVPYCGTKFAVRGIMTALEQELRHKNPQNNIKLTTIYPYIVDTGLCKNPRSRFPTLMKPVTPKGAAASIVSAQRTGLVETTLPRHFLYIEKIGRMIPRPAMQLVNDFLDTGVNSDKL